MKHYVLLLFLLFAASCKNDPGEVTVIAIPAEQLWRCVTHEDAVPIDIAYYSLTYGGFAPQSAAKNYLLTEAYSGTETPLVRGEILGGVLSVQVYVDAEGLRDLFIVGRFNAQTGTPLKIDLFYTGDLDQDGVLHEAEDYEYAEEVHDIAGGYLNFHEYELGTVIKLCLSGRGASTNWPFDLVAGFEIPRQ